MIKIRLASPEDAKKLVEIYRPYVENTAISFEYETPSEEEFRHRIENTLKRYPYYVACEEGEPVGYAYASAFKTRAAYDWSVETSIYVKQGEHKKGIGKKLYEALEETLKLQNVLNVNACIAYAGDKNDHLDNGSMFFHEKMGYDMVGTFHCSGYKFNQWYDMIWMEKMLGEHEKKAPEFLPFPIIKSKIAEI